MATRTKVKKLGNKELGLEETQRREAIIKNSLDRTKNVRPGQLSADEIRGGSPAQLDERERLRQQEMEERKTLLNTPPPTTTPSSTPTQTAPGQPQPTNAQPQEASQFNPVDAGEIAKRAVSLAVPGANVIPSVREAGQRGFQDIETARTEVTLPLAAKALDYFKTFFKKNSRTLQAGEDAMTSYMSVLDGDIALYKAGGKTFEEVAANVRQAEAAINEYEALTFSENKRNLQWYGDKGASLQANVRAQRDKLEDFKKTLLGVQQI